MKLFSTYLILGILLTLSVEAMGKSKCESVATFTFKSDNKKVLSRIKSQSLGRIKLTQNAEYSVCKGDRLIIASGEQAIVKYHEVSEPLVIKGHQVYSIVQPFGIWDYFTSLMAPKFSKNQASFSSKEMASRADEMPIKLNNVEVNNKEFNFLDIDESYELSLENVQFPVSILIHSASGDFIEQEVTSGGKFKINLAGNHPMQSFKISVSDYSDKTITFALNYHSLNAPLSSISSEKYQKMCISIANTDKWQLFYNSKCNG